MTREEAIKTLRELWRETHDSWYEEAYDMAIEALSAEQKHCWDCKHYEPKYNVCHAPEVVKQVISKLNNPCDSLLTDESNGSKEQKSKLDLISRADAIEAVMAEGRKVYTSEYANAERIIHEADAVEALAMLPSADAVQGEWVDIDNYYRMATCSHCHKVTMFEKWGEYTKPYNYCPNCGARMGDD